MIYAILQYLQGQEEETWQTGTLQTGKQLNIWTAVSTFIFLYVDVDTAKTPHMFY